MSIENCWASCLGDCDGGMSREHIISRSLFESKYLTVSGYSWCKDEPKNVGIASLTKKALCRKHNSALSKIDKAGAYAFEVLRQQTKLSIARGKVPDKRHRKLIFSIDASGLELWLLKTLINVSYGGEHCIGPASQRPGFPSDDLVQVLFRGRRLPSENGMYVAFKPDMDLYTSDQVQMAPLTRFNTHIHGAFFKFFGFPMFFDLVPGGMTIPFHDIPNVAADWHYTTRTKRFREFKANIGGRISHVVKFNWR